MGWSFLCRIFSSSLLERTDRGVWALLVRINGNGIFYFRVACPSAIWKIGIRIGINFEFILNYTGLTSFAVTFHLFRMNCLNIWVTVVGISKQNIFPRVRPILKYLSPESWKWHFTLVRELPVILRHLQLEHWNESF